MPNNDITHVSSGKHTSCVMWMLISVALCEYHKNDEELVFLEMTGHGQ
jgi:hypothetical protein